MQNLIKHNKRILYKKNCLYIALERKNNNFKSF